MEEEANALASTGRWSKENALISIRAGHKCEYCGLDFYSSASNYRSWQKDHIIPVKHGGKDEFDNYAASCSICNTQYKLQWNPLNEVGEGASREDLIKAARVYIAKLKKDDEREIKHELSLIKNIR
ncbi:MAG: HNH endonuclease [Gammaproteobacteria bacterium]|nr:HNH endonuclease [Gammaproteobacteria bacterium]